MLMASALRQDTVVFYYQYWELLCGLLSWDAARRCRKLISSLGATVVGYQTVTQT